MKTDIYECPFCGGEMENKECAQECDESAEGEGIYGTL